MSRYLDTARLAAQVASIPGSPRSSGISSTTPSSSRPGVGRSTSAGRPTPSAFAPGSGTAAWSRTRPASVLFTRPSSLVTPGGEPHPTLPPRAVALPSPSGGLPRWEGGAGAHSDRI